MRCSDLMKTVKSAGACLKVIIKKCVLISRLKTLKEVFLWISKETCVPRACVCICACVLLSCVFMCVSVCVCACSQVCVSVCVYPLMCGCFSEKKKREGRKMSSSQKFYPRVRVSGRTPGCVHSWCGSQVTFGTPRVGHNQLLDNRSVVQVSVFFCLRVCPYTIHTPDFSRLP